MHQCLLYSSLPYLVFLFTLNAEIPFITISNSSHKYLD